MTTDVTMHPYADLSDHLLEAPESPPHLGCLLAMLPTANDMISRLKPKLIHDPFLDDNGQPFTHQRLFRCHYVIFFISSSH